MNTSNISPRNFTLLIYRLLLRLALRFLILVFTLFILFITIATISRTNNYMYSKQHNLQSRYRRQLIPSTKACNLNPSECIDQSDRERIDSLLSRDRLSVDMDQQKYLPYECFLNSNPYTIPYYSECLSCSESIHGCPPSRGMPHFRGSAWDEVCEVYCWRKERTAVQEPETSTTVAISIESVNQSESTTTWVTSNIVGSQIVHVTHVQEAENQQTGAARIPGIEGHPADTRVNNGAQTNGNLAKPESPPADSLLVVAQPGHRELNRKQALHVDNVIRSVWFQGGCVLAAVCGIILAIKWGCEFGN